MPRWLIYWNAATLFLIWSAGLLVGVPIALAVATHSGQRDISRDDIYLMRQAHPGGALVDAKTFRYCDGVRWVELNYAWDQTPTTRLCEKKPTE